jgi:hypothetical protein
MYNSLDSSFIEYKELSTQESFYLSKSLTMLSENNKKLETLLAAAQFNINEIQKYLKEYESRKHRTLLSLSFGTYMLPVNVFGYTSSIGILWSLPHITNWYAGLSIPVVVFPKDYDKATHVGISLSCGIFIQ